MKTETIEQSFTLLQWKTNNQPDINDFKKGLEEKYSKTDYIDPFTIGVTFAKESTNITATLNSSFLSSFSNTDACVMLTKEPQYYLRFGALLNYIKDNIILKIKNPSKEGIFNINTDFRTQKMYSLPNRISLDPRVCIVRNSSINIGSFSSPTPQNKGIQMDPGFMLRKEVYSSYKPSIGLGGNYKSLSQVGAALVEHESFLSFNSEENKTAKAFDTLEPFTEIDDGKTNKNSAYILNIYLNFDFILESLSADDKGNISVYNLLSKICTGLNKALGGINNLEPIIDETSNTLQIIDTTPIPKPQKAPGYQLQIYGYDKIDSTNKGYLGNNYISNFVRKVDLKTVITPEYATMITVGATAGGYVKGVEATAFSKWNTGLTDRFKKDILPPKGDKSSLDDDEATSNYEDSFRDHTRRYGITSLGKFNSEESITNINFSNNLINKNISVMTEYYKYLVATSTRGKSTSGGTVGFIPFKLSLTMDGISGIKIYDVLHVDTKFLPKAYGRTVDLIVTGISHRLANNDWETSIEATVMPKTSEFPQSTNSSPTPPNTTVTGTGYPNKGNEKFFKHTGGISPAKQYPDGTFVISTKEYNKKYINPLHNRHWLQKNPEYEKLLVSLNVPLKNKDKPLKFHPDFATKLKPAFEEIKNKGLNQYLEDTGGSFAVRNVTGGTRLTNHSYGFAIDFMPNKNGWKYGDSWDIKKKEITYYVLENKESVKKTRTWNSFDIGFYEIVKIMKKNGIGWLGNSDPMHFSIYEV